MGIYIYKVTGKKVKLSNGEVANVAKFAYKPYSHGYGSEKNNNRMHRESGAYHCDREAEKGNRNEWVAMESAILHFPRKVGSFADDVALDRYEVRDVQVVK